MAKPLVSVISPVYNDEEFIGEFVDCILAQSLKDWELICIDDGSEDRSAEILDEYAKKDTRVQVIRAEHANAGVARNIGMARASGKYICFLDSDDMPRPDMLKKMSDAAEEKQADLVLCNTSSYSMKTQKEEPMPWSIRWHKLPEMRDGVFSRDDVPDRLFQLFIVSPWNKMYRRELLTENHIQAQSQIAANDVVLTQSAMACAKRICPIQDNLYVQRRDNVNSITGALGTETKHLCGYTSALGLKEKLQELGLYDLLKSTYQQLAVHNVVWYLEKQKKNTELYQADFDFLHNEGLRNLDLEELTPDAEKGCPAAEKKVFAQILEYTAYQQLQKRCEELETSLKSKEQQLQLLQQSRGMKVISAAQKGKQNLMRGPRFVRRVLKAVPVKYRLYKYSRISREDQDNDRQDKKKKEKKICILAFEKYHYNVVENMVRICNPQKNYVEVRANRQGIQEIRTPLEPEIRDAAHWKNSEIEIPGVSKEEADYIWKIRREKLIQDVADHGDYDLVLVPSPEFHPDWYEPLLKEDRKYKMIAGVHNLNDALLSPDAPADVRSFYERADGYAVIYRFLADRMKELGYDRKPVYVFPQVYLPREQGAHDSERVRFIVSGSVDASRKNYDQLADAFEMLTELHPKMALELAGSARGEYAERIRNRFRAMRETGLEFTSHKSFMPFSEFEKSMDQADFMIAPVVTETMVRGIREVYGQTKISGVQGDMIKFACPAVVIDTIRMSDDLISSVLFYATTEELAARIRDCLKPGAREAYRAKALENSLNFLPEKVMW